MPRPLRDELAEELAPWRAAGLHRVLWDVESPQAPHIRIDNRELLNFSSNDYLGLANDPVLKQAATDALHQFGVGAGASRFISGNLAPYRQLELALAEFKNQPAALVFGSGYAANVGTIAALVGPGDVVILDKLNHASIIDGARQSGATIRVYPHGDLAKLERILASVTTRARRVLIATESVFSMDGDLAPLAEICALKQRFGAWLLVDEAHATGLYGQNRRGLAEPLGLENQIEVTIGTLSKAFGCVGGYVAGSLELIEYLRHRARSVMYSTALPPAMVAAATAAVRFVMSPAGHARRDQLWRNVSLLKHGLAAVGIPNTSRSAIIPIIVGDETKALQLAQTLLDAGIFVPAIRYPTVPRGKARLRVTVTAVHSSDDIQTFLSALAEALRAHPGGVIEPAALSSSRA